MANRNNLPLQTAQLYLIAGVLSVAIGYVASTGSVQAAAVVMGLIGGVILISSPTLVLWSVLLGGLVASGLAMLYAPQLQLIRWAVALASVLLIAMALLENISRKNVSNAGKIPTIGWQILALFGVVTLAGWANGQGAAQLVVGLKSYFQVAGLYFALVMIPWPRRLIDFLPKAMLYIAFLQLPFVLHQYFFLVPRRIGYGDGIVPYDIVAGTFGATEFGGGANAVLSAYLLIAVAILLALWNNHAISLTRFICLGLPLMAPIFVNESKVSILYLLIIACVIFKNEIMLRPARAILSGAFMAMVLGGLMIAYTAYYADEADSSGGLISATIEQNFGAEVGHGEFYLNRGTAMLYWFEEHSITDPLHALIGHGPRATREGGSGIDAGATLASRRYPGMGIGLTGASALLWETGLVGFSLVLAMFWNAFRTAGVLRERYQSDPQKAGIFSGLQAGVAILTLSLFHKSFFVFDIGYQTIIMLLFGYLNYYFLAGSDMLGGAMRQAIRQRNPT